jgi:hypothetical protein
MTGPHPISLNVAGDDAEWRPAGGLGIFASMDANYECPHDGCGAQLLQTRRLEPAGKPEVALCPRCNGNLPARDGDYRLHYQLVSAPPGREQDTQI